jgi:hypothetical protein
VYDTFPSNTALTAYIQSNCFSSGEFDITSDCGCMLKLSTEGFLHRCTFKEKKYRDAIKTQKIKNLLFDFIGDILEVKGIIFGYGIGLTFVLGFVWLSFLRCECLSTIIIWFCILAVLVTLVIMTSLAYTTANKWDNADPQTHSSTEIGGLKVISLLCLIMSVIWFVMICFTGKAIQLAIKMVSMTAECLEHMPMIMLTPVVQLIALVVFLVSALYDFIS